MGTGGAKLSEALPAVTPGLLLGLPCLVGSRWAVSLSGAGRAFSDHRMEPALTRPPHARESLGILLKCRAESVGLGLRLCISDKLRSRAGNTRQHTARIGSALHVCSRPGSELASPGEVFKCADAGTHSMPNKSQYLRVEPQHRSVSVSSWQSVTLLTYYFWPC